MLYIAYHGLVNKSFTDFDLKIKISKVVYVFLFQFLIQQVRNTTRKKPKYSTLCFAKLYFYSFKHANELHYAHKQKNFRAFVQLNAQFN